MSSINKKLNYIFVALWNQFTMYLKNVAKFYLQRFENQTLVICKYEHVLDPILQLFTRFQEKGFLALDQLSVSKLRFSVVTYIRNQNCVI
jgi:hypothetical protein